MRRVLIGSVVLFVAACGGGAVPQTGAVPSTERNAIPTDSASAALIETLTQEYGVDAVDTCLAAWQDAKEVNVHYHGSLDQVGATFRKFVSDCVGAPAPSNLRANRDPAALRSARPSAME